MEGWRSLASTKDLKHLPNLRRVIFDDVKRASPDQTEDDEAEMSNND